MGIIHGFAHLLVEDQVSYFMQGDSETDVAVRCVQAVLELICEVD